MKTTLTKKALLSVIAFLIVTFCFTIFALTVSAEETNVADLGEPVETWDISATTSDNVVANLYNDPDNEGMYTLVISGTGAMKSWSTNSYVPWYYSHSKITNVVIENGVTSIGGIAFMNCTSLESITIPDSVISIGNNAFYSCTALTEIKFNATAMNDFSERNNVFSNAGTSGNGIKVTISKNVTKIPAYLFNPYNSSSYSPKITSIEFDEGSVCESIGKYAFGYCTLLKSVKIGESVSSINSYAFYNCTSLESIEVHENNTVYKSIDGVLYSKDVAILIFCPQGKGTSLVIPDGVTSIERSAFSGCTLLESITIGNSVTSIGRDAFYNCTSLTEINFNATVMDDSLGWLFQNGGKNGTGIKVTIGKNVTKIPTYLFYAGGSNSPKITSVEFEEGSVCESIGNYAFEYCASLKSITISDSVTTIGRSAFYGCTSLESITVHENNTVYKSIDGVLYSKDGKTLIFYPQGKGASFIIPDGVTSIGEYAFYGCTTFESITIENGVTSIESYAFYECTSLKSVTIGNSVTSIGERAFYCCTALTEINFNAVAMNDLGSNSNFVFFSAGSRGNGIKVTIGKNVTKIPAYLFCPGNSSPNIISVEFEEGSVCESIGNNAFSKCTSLESVTLGDSVPSIGYQAFYNCTALESITVDENNAEYKSIDGVLYSKDGKTLIFYPQGKGTSFIIPDSVTSIGSYAFYGCSLLESVTIPDSVTSIGPRAFSGCSSLKSVTIPDSVTTLGGYAFYECTALTEINFNAIAMDDLSSENYVFSYAGKNGNGIKVTIGKNVTKIPTYLFYTYIRYASSYVPKITSVEFEKGSVCESIGNYAFGYSTSLESVTIGESVTSINRYTFYNCTALESIMVDENNAEYKSIDGVLYSKDGTTLIFYPAGKLDTCFIIPNSVTTIEEYAFYNCTSLESVTIPDSVTTIEECAFYNCTALESVTIGDSVTSIGNGAFRDCTALSEIKFNAIAMNDLSSGNSVFYNAGKNGDGVKVTIGKNVTKIPAYLFCPANHSSSYSPKIISVEFEEGSVCESIGNYAFYYCTSLESITIPDSVNTIGESAFSGCTSLESITIPDSVTSIGSSSFYGCSKLKLVIIDSPTIASSITSGSSNGYLTYNAKTIAINPEITEIGSYITDNFTYVTTLNVTYNGGEGEYVVYSKHSHESGTGIWSENCSCSECGIQKTHVAGETVVENVVEATCQAAGSYENVVYCTDCGAELSREKVETPKADHAYELISRIPFGNSTYTCNMCGDTYEINEYGNPIETWDISATSNDNVIAELYNDPDNDDMYALRVYGTGAMKDWDYYNPVLWKDYKNCTSFILVDTGVTNIGANAFSVFTNLTDIDISDGVESIGNSAFSSCSSLTSIKIPFSVTKIGDYAFANCIALTSFEIPESVTIISNQLFFGCTNLMSVSIPNGVTIISYEAFENCTNLKSIELPNGVVKISQEAFSNCGLTSINIPESVTDIDLNAFYKCKNLKSVYITDVDAWCQINYGYPNANPLSVASDAKLYLNEELLTSVCISEGVEKISDYAFYNCSNLTYIEIPKSLTSVGRSAFAGCSNLDINIVDITSWLKVYFDYNSNPNAYYLYLNGVEVSELIVQGDVESLNTALKGCKSITHVTLLDGVKVIDGSFSNCINLLSVEIPSSVTSIRKSAFAGCSSLTSIEIPNSVTSIGDSAFAYCSSLTSIEIPHGITSVNSETFKKCSNLINVQLPSTLTTIGWQAFYECGNLVNIEIPNNVNKIADQAFAFCRKLTSIEIPNGITSIGYWTFNNCDSLTTVMLPESVTSIGRQAFYQCDNLTTINIPNTVTIIEEEAFYFCINLASINIPNTVTSIGRSAFSGCNNLKFVIIDSPAIVSSITSNSSNGNLTYFATTIAINADITEIGSYITDNFTNVTTIGDYVVYSKHSHEADSTVWGEADENGVQVCSECGLEKVSHVHSYDNENDGVCNGCGEVRGVARIGEEYFATFQEALANGSGKTIVLLETVVITEDTVFDISDVTIESFGDVFEVQAGTLTLNGNGVVNAGISGVGSWCAVWANGGHVVINGGTYFVDGDSTESTDPNHQNDLIYTKNGGTVTINGGTFIAGEGIWALNENDSTGGAIVVYGGTFIGFNPANNVSEGEGTNFLASGYAALENNGAYTVEKSHAHTEVEIPAVLPTPSTTGYTAGIQCSECGEYIVEPQEINVTTTPGYKIFGINSTNLILGNNISLDYKVNVSEGYGTPYMVFVFEGKEYIVTEYKIDGGKPVFNFAETRPHKIATNVEAYVYAETADGYTVDKYDYSVMKYCIAKLKKNESVEVISDLLVFGAETQKYVASMTNTTVADEDLITSIIEAQGYTLTPSTFTSIPESLKAQYVDVDANDDLTWKSSTVVLGSSTQMVYKFAANDITGLSIKIEVDGVEKMMIDAADLEYDAVAKRYIVSVNCVSAVQYGSEVKATFVKNGVESDSVAYSINGFLYNNLAKNEGTVLGDLMKALYVYGNTTYNHFYN